MASFFGLFQVNLFILNYVAASFRKIFKACSGAFLANLVFINYLAACRADPLRFASRNLFRLTCLFYTR